MRYNKAGFVGSFVRADQLPRDGIPEIAFVGRSNVGKSSLINCIVGMKGLAKTSSTPGKTRALNFYRVDDAVYLVDLPGYGYAQVSKAEKRHWGRLIEEYLADRESLMGVIQLIDIRHPPTDNDVLMWQFLTSIKLPTLLVATKADKVARGQWKAREAVIRRTMNLGEAEIIIFSSATRQGVLEVRRQIEAWAKDY